MTLYRYTPSEKTSAEFKCLFFLRLAVMRSVFVRPDDELLDDPAVELRLNQLLTTVRRNLPSHTFQRAFCDRAGELVPGVFLKVPHSMQGAALYRDTETDNVIFLGVA